MRITTTFFLVTYLLFSFSAYAKRRAPAPVKSVRNAGLRYEVPHWSIDFPKMKHNGGYIRVVNEKNNLGVCLKEIYEVTYDKNLESDVQDNFITKLSVKGNDLIIETEKSGQFKKPIENFCN